VYARKRAIPEPKPAARPIQPEELAERYVGRWTIYRESAPDGSGGQWVAGSCDPSARGPEQIMADDVNSLARKLAAVES
jgi:hypothetical protein